MAIGLEGWSSLGIASVVAVAVGAVLLVAYAVRGGLVHRGLDAQETSDVIDGPADPLDPVNAIAQVRTGDGRGAPGAATPRSLGLAGAALLIVGLAIGLVTVASGSGPAGSGSGAPFAAPSDCAQSWNGCPQTTPRP